MQSLQVQNESEHYSVFCRLFHLIDAIEKVNLGNLYKILLDAQFTIVMNFLAYAVIVSNVGALEYAYSKKEIKLSKRYNNLIQITFLPVSYTKANG